MRSPRRPLLRLLVCLTASTTFNGCSRQPPPPSVEPRSQPATEEPGTKPAASLEVTSPAFTEGKPIPSKYTCDGENVSPPLRWSGVPEGMKSLALICDDPDAPGGTWVHWVVYDLPATATELPEGLSATKSLPGGGAQGTNDFRKIGYGGPCPPAGKPHHYHFRLYALDTEVGLPSTATKADLTKAMAGHVVGDGELVGTYRRR